MACTDSDIVFAKLDPGARSFYQRAMRTMNDAGGPFLVGGAYAFGCYTGIERHTKDLDLFLPVRLMDRAKQVLEDSGYRTELAHPHWLAKVFEGENFVDLIFASGNGVSFVDETWFTKSVEDELLGVPVRLVAPEEIIWMKAFIMERERFDGADVAHLIRDRGETMDWEHLLHLFGPHWRVLYCHVILFGYIYPSRLDSIPSWVLDELAERLSREESHPIAEEVCRGTLLSRAQFLSDIEERGLKDARRWPHGQMSGEEIASWTSKIDSEEAAI